MVIKLAAGLSLSLIMATTFLPAQNTIPPAPANANANAPVVRRGRNADVPDANAPVSKYSYFDAFAPFFYNTERPPVSRDQNTGRTVRITNCLQG
jgi:hypothetical protein